MLLAAALNGWAQGSNVGMGGLDEGVASILERLNVVEKKNEAFNIFLNTTVSYEEPFEKGEQSGFHGRYMRFEARGFLDKHWSYRFRYQLNKTWERQDDGFSNSLNIMMVNYQITDRLRVTGGKWALSMGGFEYDENAIQVLDSRLTIGKFRGYIDYYHAWEGIDRHGIVSADAATAGLTTEPTTLRDVRYQAFVGRLQYHFTPHWLCFVKAFAEKASLPDDPVLKDYRHNYGYQAALQWIPDLTQDARLSLAYVGKTTTYNDAIGLPNVSTNRVELSLIYRIKIF